MTTVPFTFLGWIALAVIGVWLMPRRFQPWASVAAACAFLGFYSPVSLALLLFLAAVSYHGFSFFQRKLSGIAVLLALAVSLFIWQKAAHRIDVQAPETLLVPLGFSYYMLRIVHYTVDRYKGTTPPHNFGDYLAYLFFLPVLLAGPINRFQEYYRESLRRRWDSTLFSRGCERILYGYGKIVILGNYLVSLKMKQAIDNLNGEYAGLAAYLDCLRYGLNLLFQFSGYSDIALGFALLLGYRISENFRYPLLATNINEFWRRWHISLSSWCRDYVFMPVLALGRRPATAVFASMLVLGLWHEFSARYILWGAYHGAGIAVWQLFQRVKKPEWLQVPSTVSVVAAALSWAVTMNFVLLSFALTKEADVRSALRVYQSILGW